MSRKLLVRKDEHGQTLVEFALILPILLLLVMAIIQFGIIFSAQIGITNAAREGARIAAVNHSDDEVKDRVEAAVGGHISLNLSRSDILITKDGTGDIVSVSVKGYLDLILPLPDVFFSNPMELSAKSSMRVEKVPASAVGP